MKLSLTQLQKNLFLLYKKSSTQQLNEVYYREANHLIAKVNTPIKKQIESLLTYILNGTFNWIQIMKENLKQKRLISILLLDPSTISKEQRSWAEFTFDTFNFVGNYAYDHKGILISSTVVIVLILIGLNSGNSPDSGSGYNVPQNTSGIDTLGNSDFTLQAVDVILQPEVSRALYTILAGSAGLVLTWTLSGWSESSAPLVPLTLEELDSLKRLAESILDLNPTILQDMRSNPTLGLKSLGEVSGIFSVDAPQSSRKVIKLLLPLLSAEDVTFEGLKNTSLSLGQQQNRHRLLMMYELLSLMLATFKERGGSF